MHYDLVEFGNAARKIRLNKGIKMSHLSELCNVNRDTIRKIEKGMVIPKIETLDKLSYVYKHDMFLLFLKYRLTVNIYMDRVINRVSKSFKNNEYNIIDEEVEKFKNIFIESPLFNDTIIKLKANQFQLYLEAIADIDKTVKEKSRNNITKLFLCLGHPNEELLNKNLSFDKLEIRIIILLATVYRFKNEFIRSIDLLQIANNELLKSFREDKEFLQLYILVNYNIMTYYHRLDNFEKSLDIYKHSLAVLDSEIGIYNFTYYIIRVGVDKYLSNDLSGSNYIVTALSLIKDSGNDEHFKFLLNMFTNRYPSIDFDILS